MTNTRVEWVPHKAFESGEVVCRVNKLPLSDRPRFSAVVGRKPKDGGDRLTLFIQVDQIPDAIAALEMAYNDFIAEEQARDAAAAEKLEKKKAKREGYLANVERRREENRARASGNGKGGKKSQ